MTDNTKGCILGAVSAASYGINPIAVLLYNDGVGVDSVLFYRYILAVAALGLVILARKESFAVRLRELPWLAGAGLLFSFSSLALFESYKHIDVSIASTLLFVYPAMVTLIMMIFFGEKPTPAKIAALALVLLGVVLLNGGSDVRAVNAFGVAIVLLSALAYAIYIVACRESRLNALPSIKFSFWSLLFGSTIYIVRLDFCTELQPLTSVPAVACALALALLPTLVSITTLARAIHLIGPSATAILGALEPVTAVLLGILLFSEHPTLPAIAGMLIILVAVTLIVAGKPAQKAFPRQEEPDGNA